MSGNKGAKPMDEHMVKVSDANGFQIMPFSVLQDVLGLSDADLEHLLNTWADEQPIAYIG
jgi:hypothetical protein